MMLLARPTSIWVVCVIVLSYRIEKNAVIKTVKEREEKTAHMAHFPAMVWALATLAHKHLHAVPSHIFEHPSLQRPPDSAMVNGRFQPCVPGSLARCDKGEEVNGTVYITKELSGRAGGTYRLDLNLKRTGS